MLGISKERKTLLLFLYFISHFKNCNGHCHCCRNGTFNNLLNYQRHMPRLYTCKTKPMNHSSHKRKESSDWTSDGSLLVALSLCLLLVHDGWLISISILFSPNWRAGTSSIWNLISLNTHTHTESSSPKLLNNAVTNQHNAKCIIWASCLVKQWRHIVRAVLTAACPSSY